MIILKKLEYKCKKENISALVELVNERDSKDKDNSKINTDDAWKRAFYGRTIGGFAVIGIIMLLLFIRLF